MKGVGGENRNITEMLDGKQPFDVDKAKAALTTMSENAAKMPALFPDNSKDGDTTALPAIWENKADFDAKMAKFSADAKAAAGKVTNAETLEGRRRRRPQELRRLPQRLSQEDLIARLVAVADSRAACPTDAPPLRCSQRRNRHRIATRRQRMLRKLFLLAVAAAIVGLVAFWVLTIPGTVPASALGPHTPNLDNGKTMFFAGGCASCHATPEQDDKTRLGGGLGAEVAVRHVLRPQHFVRQERRHRPLDRGAVRHRHGEGNLAGRPALLSGVSRTRPISA